MTEADLRSGEEWARETMRGVRSVTEAGTPPGRREFEITLLGPGYGESIALHVGDGVCPDSRRLLPRQATEYREPSATWKASVSIRLRPSP